MRNKSLMIVVICLIAIGGAYLYFSEKGTTESSSEQFKNEHEETADNNAEINNTLPKEKEQAELVAYHELPEEERNKVHLQLVFERFDKADLETFSEPMHHSPVHAHLMIENNSSYDVVIRPNRISLAGMDEHGYVRSNYAETDHEMTVPKGETEYIRNVYTDEQLVYFERLELIYTLYSDGTSGGSRYDNFGAQVPNAVFVEDLNLDRELQEETSHLTKKEKVDVAALDERAAGLDVIEYARRSTLARNTGDYLHVEGYVKQGSPIDEDLKRLIESDYARGVKLDYMGGEVLDTKVVTSGEVYDVLIRHTFDITGVKKEGVRTFESTFRVEYDSNSGRFLPMELLDESEL